MEKTEKTPVPRNFWLRPMLSAADIVFVCQCVFVHLCMSVRGKRKKLLMRNWCHLLWICVITNAKVI